MTMPAEPARKENVLTRKIGPMPTWAWIAIISAAIIGWAYYKNKKSNAGGTSTPTGTDASQVPQFVNQVPVSIQPPTVNVPPDTDTDKDEDKDDRKPKKKPVNRKHPTHHRETVTPGGPREKPPHEIRRRPRGPVHPHGVPVGS